MFVYLSDELIRAMVRDREEEARETRPHSHPHTPREEDNDGQPAGGGHSLWLRFGSALAK